jgi:MFS family permease
VAIFIPLSSWIADRFGARRVFAGAIVVFTLASLLCGLSQNIEMFVLARVLQGIGGALGVAICKARRVTTTTTTSCLFSLN